MLITVNKEISNSPMDCIISFKKTDLHPAGSETVKSKSDLSQSEILVLVLHRNVIVSTCLLKGRNKNRTLLYSNTASQALFSLQEAILPTLTDTAGAGY